MATSLTALMQGAKFSFITVTVLGIPVFFIMMYFLCFSIATDVRLILKKVFWYDKRQDPRAIWQVGIGMLFFFAQVGFVEVFWRASMVYQLGGMPLYLVFAFMNAFMMTIIYEELFYQEEVLKCNK